MNRCRENLHRFLHDLHYDIGADNCGLDAGCLSRPLRGTLPIGQGIMKQIRRAGS